jgi:serine/threonine protein kinase
MADLVIQKISEDLVGETFNGWKLTEKIAQPDNNTGGNFSVGYYAVGPSGNNVFVKVMDYYRALVDKDPPRKMQEMTKAYVFEVDLLKLCNDKKMKYIVRIIDEGTVYIKNQPISFIVLEKADASARNMIDISRFLDYAWCLRSLHNVAVAVEGLHKERVAHQDIKPSNVVLFSELKLSKLGDFGRSSKIGVDMPHDEFSNAGDPNHTAFELLYNQINPDWEKRRYGCDMFMIGDLIMSYFNNISIVTATLNKLGRDFYPGIWKGNYDEICPYITYAFYEAIKEFNEHIPLKLRTELQKLVIELCNPVVSKRGDTRYSDGRRYSLERYITRLDLLAERHEWELKRSLLNEQQ